MKRFQCTCGARVFFENSECIRCGKALGFDPETATMSTATGSGSDLHFARSDGRTLIRCGNHELGAGCNWLVELDSEDPLCGACTLNRTIPDLSVPENVEKWSRVELAKRRLIYGMNALGLRVANMVRDPEHGVAFDFLAPGADTAVMTGHADGVITLNLSEADPVTREQVRASLNERYRTLLGHFRHEIGHRYFQLLLADGSDELRRFRELFGDETTDYAAALEKHYAEGPNEGWPDAYISAYATAHPYEDWAEVWAHYLHICDALETAAENGFAAARGSEARVGHFDSLLAAWLELTVGFNELNRSLGHEDAYPFTITPPVRDKLAFIHDLIHPRAEQRRSDRAGATPRERSSGPKAAELESNSKSTLEGNRPQVS
jgi:hypothetical protein